MRRDDRHNRKTNRSNKLGNVQQKNIIKHLLFIVAFLVMFFIITFTFKNLKNNFDLANNKTDSNEDILISNEDVNEKIDDSSNNEDVSFKMTAIGDVLCHNTQYWDAYNKETNTYDFNYVYDDIRSYVKNSDIAVASLETSFAGAERGYSNYPTFNSPDDLAYSLKDLGVDVISTAGNHCLDMGFSGLSRTIDVLDKADISHLGTYKTEEDQNKILFKYIKGVKIAFINYTYGTNGIPVPSDKNFCVNLIDKDLIKKHIESAKSQNADIIVACMHWGTEYRITQNQEQEELADFLFENGVNIIIGNHPHVLEPMEKRTITLDDGSTRDGFVIYALGNFICDQNADNTRNSIILDLDITKHTNGDITIDKATYTPICMYKNPSKTIRKMKLIDLEKTIDNYESGIDSSIGAQNYNYFKKQLEKIKNIVGEEIIE